MMTGEIDGRVLPLAVRIVPRLANNLHAATARTGVVGIDILHANHDGRLCPYIAVGLRIMAPSPAFR